MIRKIEELIGYDRNPRINNKAVDHVLESLKRHGQVKPIVISEAGFPFTQEIICCGHTTVDALKKFGAKEVKVVVKQFDNEAEFVDYNLRDNKTSEFAEWNEALLVELSTDFDIDLNEMGFDIDALTKENEGLTDEDEVPEVPEEPTSVLGQIWKLGEHRLMCGDSTDKNTVEALMDGEKADMVFTDPPYGIGLDKEGQKLGKSKAYGAVLNDHSTDAAKLAIDLLMSMNIETMLIWGGNYFTDILPPKSSWIVWDKQGGKHVTFADCEMAWVSTGKPARIFQHIWDGFRRDSERGEERTHPTQKPIELCIECLNEIDGGPIVIDLFGGSGSTLIACEKTNRKCRMMELDPKYCDVIIKRWEDFTGNKAELIK